MPPALPPEPPAVYQPVSAACTQSGQHLRIKSLVPGSYYVITNTWGEVVKRKVGPSGTVLIATQEYDTSALTLMSGKAAWSQTAITKTATGTTEDLQSPTCKSP